MATDDERREVAERLREHSGARLFTGEDVERLIGIELSGFRPKDADNSYNRLADLIEPSESGQNRDRNQDSVQKESPIVQIEHECDREALLALAEDVADSAAMATVMDASEGAKMLAEMLLDIARRIREALGVTDG